MEEVKKAEKVWHCQTHYDMVMNMVLCNTRSDTLSHAVHVNKDETCAHVQEKYAV